MTNEQLEALTKAAERVRNCLQPLLIDGRGVFRGQGGAEVPAIEVLCRMARADEEATNLYKE